MKLQARNYDCMNLGYAMKYNFRSFKPILVLVCSTWVLSACEVSNISPQTEPTHSVEAEGETHAYQQRMVNADDDTNNWLLHGRTLGEQRFSPLNAINEDTVSELDLAWHMDMPEPRGQEATPIVVDGMMYTTTAWSNVMAVNAVTGEKIWHFDPEVPRSTGVKSCCDAVNRGVAYMDGRVFVGTLDGRLIALDADSGEQVWSVVTVDQNKNYTITGAPRIANGKVYIGNGGAEYGVRGYVSAYDANNGEMLWRFYTVPGGPGDPTGTEPVASQTSTWNGEWWKLGGGGTVWDSMAFDSDLNTLYFGVGNGTPWNPNLRSAGEGDNWFLSSIVAVDADSGEYKWHYQTTPGEGWDYTATQHMILADLKIKEIVRKVLIQAPKNGFFYVLDRETGELLSAENFVDINWASHVDLETGRPVVNPEAQYWKTGKTTFVSPAFLGAHNWHPMSYSKDTGLVYLPAQELAFPYMADDNQVPKNLAVNIGIDTTFSAIPDIPEVIDEIKKMSKGLLVAWDPVAQKEVWSVEYPGAWNGGVLSTAGGLVFQGTATGFLNAYSAIDGEALWSFPTQTGVVAPPISYAVDGEQYITVSAGWGGIFPLISGVLAWDAADGQPINRSRLLTFKLGGSAELPPASEQLRDMPDLTAIDLDPEVVKLGFGVYERFCAGCHGGGAIGGGVVPDLRYSGFIQEAAAFKSAVLDGLLEAGGMVGFGSEISEEEAEAIRAYLIFRNQVAQKLGDTKRLSR